MERLRLARLVEGSLRVDRRNRLTYLVASSAGSETLNLDGAWALTPGHELALTLHETGRRDAETLYLKGAVIEARANALIFALHRTVDGGRTAQRLSLSGRWVADAQNRLSFLAEKADGAEDRLTFQGGWEIGAHHELLYRYRQRAKARGVREAHTLVFDGAWDIPGADRLAYRLSGSSDSSFEFRASLRSPSLRAGADRLVYEVGIGLSESTTERRRVALFGAWKLNRDFSVSFEVPYAEGRIQAIRFEGAATLTPKDRIAVSLRSNRREPIGVTVTFTRRLIGDAQLFLQLRKAAEEQAAIGGVQVRF